ncbi:transcriptional regulator [Enterococcus florum]|uniref:Transcriptional regulator n=1 Tax=Enterococcus florum TaxID=2480627 RepID=A0A4P5P6S4_9ENTE|nr:helix-turn-helix domain-containing protein [Enterococcus florum]GCF93627.1 transcriptional regulator [Enterococcus florum]
MKQIQQTEFSLCPKFEKGFSILGKKWNGLIIDVLLEEGPQRFVDLATKIPHVSDRVLAERLRELEFEGLLQREEDSESQKRLVYCLTDKGRDLDAVMKNLHQWGEKWITEEECS